MVAGLGAYAVARTGPAAADGALHRDTVTFVEATGQGNVCFRWSEGDGPLADAREEDEQCLYDRRITRGRLPAPGHRIDIVWTLAPHGSNGTGRSLVVVWMAGDAA